MPQVVLDDRTCRALTAAKRPCTNRARHNGLCFVHLRKTVIVTDHVVDDKIYVYVMGGDTPIVKVGKSADPAWRCHSLKTGTGLASRQPGFQVLTLRIEKPPTFTEKEVHKFLGNTDRVEREWWHTTEGVLIKLALCGLTWPDPVVKAPGR